ncbi:MAG: ATP-binding protein [Methanosarcinaceae archaeon]
MLTTLQYYCFVNCSHLLLCGEEGVVYSRIGTAYHRSYEIREPIEVRIMPQELVVLSFPGPDRSIRLEDLKQGKAVSCRYHNRLIGEFLKELDLTEGRSTGISKILKVMKSNGSPPPEFETDDDRSYFLIRLPVHPKADLGDFVKTEDSEKTQVKTPDQILRMVNENPDMTLSKVAQKIGKSLSAVERASSKLVKAGRLRYVGPKKGGHWEVNEKT